MRNIERTRTILFFILIAAFVVRLTGVNFGLPFLYHNDEPIIVNYALAYGAGDLNPHFFKIPPFLSYILFFLYGVFYLLGRVTGLFGGVNDFGYFFLNDVSVFYLIGRIASGVVLGTASVYLMYVLGKRVFSRPAGLIAALFLAFNFLHVRDSHYIYLDVPLVFFTTLYFIVLGTLYKKDRPRDYMISGFVMALAVSMKYNGILMAVPTVLIMARALIRARKEIPVLLKKYGLYISFFVLGLFLTNPFMFLDWKFFFARTANMPFTGSDPWYHIRISLLGSCGIYMCIAAVIGMITAFIKKKDIFTVSLVCFTAAYYFILTRASQPAERYIFPILPIVLLFSAYLVTVLSDLTSDRRIKTTVLVFCCLLFMVPSGLRIYHSERLFLAEDTRTQCYDWITKNIAYGSAIALDATGPVFPRLKQTKELVEESFSNFNNPKFATPEGSMSYKVKLLLSNPDYPEDTYRILYLRKKISRKNRFLGLYPESLLDMDELRRQGIEYVVAHNILLSSYYKDFLEQLEEGSVLVKEFSPYKPGRGRIKPLEESSLAAAPFSFRELSDRERPGPVLRIYRLR